MFTSWFLQQKKFKLEQKQNSCKTKKSACFTQYSHNLHRKYRIGRIDLHRENMKKKRRELEQASLDAASDLLDTDSNATFAMVNRIFFLKFS